MVLYGFLLVFGSWGNYSTVFLGNDHLCNKLFKKLELDNHPLNQKKHFHQNNPKKFQNNLNSSDRKIFLSVHISKHIEL